MLELVEVCTAIAQWVGSGMGTFPISDRARWVGMWPPADSDPAVRPATLADSDREGGEVPERDESSIVGDKHSEDVVARGDVHPVVPWPRAVSAAMDN